jgi:hypothetical protein
MGSETGTGMDTNHCHSEKQYHSCWEQNEDKRTSMDGQIWQIKVSTSPVRSSIHTCQLFIHLCFEIAVSTIFIKTLIIFFGRM